MIKRNPMTDTIMPQMVLSSAIMVGKHLYLGKCYFYLFLLSDYSINLVVVYVRAPALPLSHCKNCTIIKWVPIPPFTPYKNRFNPFRSTLSHKCFLFRQGFYFQQQFILNISYICFKSKSIEVCFIANKEV